MVKLLVIVADIIKCLLQIVRSRHDMTHFEALYRSALAADAILNTLSADEKKEVLQNADCLAVFIQSKKILPDCLPLRAYGLK